MWIYREKVKFKTLIIRDTKKNKNHAAKAINLVTAWFLMEQKAYTKPTKVFLGGVSLVLQNDAEHLPAKNSIVFTLFALNRFSCAIRVQPSCFLQLYTVPFLHRYAV